MLALLGYKNYKKKMKPKKRKKKNKNMKEKILKTLMKQIRLIIAMLNKSKINVKIF